MLFICKFVSVSPSDFFAEKKIKLTLIITIYKIIHDNYSRHTVYIFAQKKGKLAVSSTKVR